MAAADAADKILNMSHPVPGSDGNEEGETRDDNGEKSVPAKPDAPTAPQPKRSETPRESPVPTPPENAPQMSSADPSEKLAPSAADPENGGAAVAAGDSAPTATPDTDEKVDGAEATSGTEMQHATSPSLQPTSSDGATAEVGDEWAEGGGAAGMTIADGGDRANVALIPDNAGERGPALGDAVRSPLSSRAASGGRSMPGPLLRGHCPCQLLFGLLTSDCIRF
jgi:hypothetical protein